MAILRRVMTVVSSAILSTGLLAYTLPSQAAANAQPHPSPASLSINTGPQANPNNNPKSFIPPAPKLDLKSYVLMDYQTGQIIAQKDMHERFAPASLTKMMVLYLTEKALASGEISLNSKVRISKKAWKTGGSRMFVRAGSQVPVKDLISGIIVDSGNDATVALSQFLGGGLNTFVAMMNQQAQMLGMKDSHFSNPTGLPTDDHYSSAYDLALLARAIIKDYPQYYHFYKQKSFTWDGIKQSNRNKLLWSDPSVDGLKTGHTDNAGYCLVTSAQRNGTRLIAVVMGSPSDNGRDRSNESLLNYGFRFFKTVAVYQPNQVVTQARVWKGTQKQVALGINDGLSLVVPKGQSDQLTLLVQINNDIKAPVKQGDVLGKATVTLAGKVIAQKPLVALQNDAKGGIWTRMTDSISLAFHNMFSSKTEDFTKTIG